MRQILLERARRGAHARNQSLTKEERIAAAKHAVAARWKQARKRARDSHA